MLGVCGCRIRRFSPHRADDRGLHIVPTRAYREAVDERDHVAVAACWRRSSLRRRSLSSRVSRRDSISDELSSILDSNFGVILQ
jgi:hypothetical protein